MTTSKTCKVENCTKSVVAHGLCSAHYSKLRKYGDPTAGRHNIGGTCDFEGCENQVHAHRLCRVHYERYKKHGDPSIRRRVKVCSVDGCLAPFRANGYCEFHNDRARRHNGNPLGGGEKRLSRGSLGTCKVEGCDDVAVASHLCRKHYSKFKKYGDPLAGGTQDGRSKDWRVNKLSYVERFDRTSPYAASNGFVFQHRQVMGEHIGRPLRRDENVHHKNGNRADNRIENLELWSKSQPAGQRVADKVKWAKEILAEYGDLDIL